MRFRVVRLQSVVHEQYVVLCKDVLMWCNACDNGSTDADGKQRRRHTGTSIMDRTVCCADVFIRRKRTVKPSNMAQGTDISLDNFHSIAHV